MEETQSFRLTGTKEYVKIPIQHVDGQSVVYWESIEQVFPGVRHVMNGEVAVTVKKDSKDIRIRPSRIMHCPGVVLDVVLSTTVVHANHSAALVCMGLGDATDDASSADEAVDALQVVASPAVENITETKPSFRQIVKLASKKAQVFEIEQQLISSLHPAIQKTVQASLRARNMSVQAHNDGRMEDCERHRNESDGHFQELKEIMVKNADMAAHTATLMLAKQDELNAKQDEIKQLQIQNAEAMETKQDELNAKQDAIKQLQIHNAEAMKAKQDEIKQLQIQNAEAMEAKQDEIKQLQIQNAEAMDTKQDELNARQDKIEKLQIQASVDMKKMREELMGQFSVLQCRIQAVLTQTYELHEYPIPRLFVVLPQDPSRWHSMNPLSKKFRLYFLCECGEHTKSINSQTKIPHHIHLAKHEGYEIARPSEFFQQYGSYVVTVLKILKLGIIVAGVAVPALPLLISTESVDQATASLQKLQDHIELGVDRTIGHIDNLLAHDGGVDEEAGEQVDNKEALEGADLRKLDTFLKGNDGNKVLGNLYRTVTDKGHVKWVCIDHYRENYNKKATQAFRRAVDLVSGSFDENIGRVEVDLRLREQAEQFYAALEQARSVHELKIKLSWETTYGDFKQLRDTLSRTSVGILEFGYTGTGPASDYMNRNRRYEPIRQIMRHPSIQSFTMTSIHDDFLQRSNLNAADSDFSNLKRLVIGGFDSDAFVDKFKLVLSHAPNVSSLSLVTPKRLFEGSSPWSRRARIFSEVTDMAISHLEHEDKVSIELDTEMKTSNDSRLQLQIPHDFLKTCNLWPADAEFQNLKRLAIKRLDSHAAFVMFYLVHAPALSTLDLADNEIGDNGAQALAEALKTNKTLTTLNLEINKIGDNGAQALAEAFKTNKTLTTLNLESNKIGDNGAKALAEALKTNSTVTTLNLKSNSIGDDGAKALAEALKTNSTLTNLDLQSNKIGFSGACDLWYVLKINSNLITLDLTSNLIPVKAAEAMFAAFKINSTNVRDHPLSCKDLVSEPSTLQFLGDCVQQEPLFKKQLLELIELSKKNAKAQRAAAFAITILVKAGHQFNGADLREIKIRGADLSGGEFDSAQLQKADLTRVNLRNIWLRNADLSEANMRDATFGELPYLVQRSAVQCCVYSPDGKVCALGLYSNEIKLHNITTWKEMHTLQGHDDMVAIVVYSPDGKQIASGSDDRTVRLWNPLGGSAITVFRGHTARIECVVYSPNDDLLASCSVDKTVRLWNGKTLQSGHVFEGHENIVTSVVFSPSGNHVVSGSYDNTVRIWSAQDGSQIRTLSQHTSCVKSVVYSPDGKHIASASYDKTVRIWDSTSGNSIQTLLHTDKVTSVAYSPNGLQIAVGSGNHVQLWDPKMGNPLHLLCGHTDYITSVVYSPTGHQIASCSYDKTVRLWDTQSGAPGPTLNGHVNNIMSVEYSPNGKEIATASLDKTVRLWTIQDDDDIDSTESEEYSGRYSQKLAINLDKRVRFHTVRTRGHTDRVNSVTYSPKRCTLASGGFDRTLRLWNAKTGVPIKTFGDHVNQIAEFKVGRIERAMYSPSGGHIVFGSDDMCVYIWNIETGKVVHELVGHDDCVTSVVYSPDGKKVASGSEDWTVYVWDAELGTERHRLVEHSAGVTDVAYSACGKQIASGSFDKTVILWHADSGEFIKRLVGHTAMVTSVVYSPDGKWIASGSNDKTVRVWEALTEHVIELKGHTDRVRSVVFSPSSQEIASGSLDSSVKLWEVGSGQLLTTIKVHQSPIRSITWVENDLDKNGHDKTCHEKDCHGKNGLDKNDIESFLAAGGDDRSIRVWSVRRTESIPQVLLHWSSTHDRLVVTGARFGKTLGLNDINMKLMEQRGARGISSGVVEQEQRTIQAMKLRTAFGNVVAMHTTVAQMKAPDVSSSGTYSLPTPQEPMDSFSFKI